ncbi:MAG: NUDIX hydrolase [Oleispira antarctica]|nr:NUDIX hydrolase [Oleispira antarctica]MBQ0791840.1 NUDIX hydrolase [Oleispira antarctica]
MKFCSECAQPISQLVPEGDNRQRYVCLSCDIVHYKNPSIVAGTLPTYQEQILLCKRAIEPRKGYWTLPAGFMENGETTEEGALRETLEEANARIKNPRLYTMITVPHISQVHIFFHGELADLDFSCGPESLEVQLFDEVDIPWQELAFPTTSKTLKHFFSDRQTILNENLSTQLPTHVFDISEKDRLKLG